MTVNSTTSQLHIKVEALHIKMIFEMLPKQLDKSLPLKR